MLQFESSDELDLVDFGDSEECVRDTQASLNQCQAERCSF
ncbi:hypothetical protein GBAR_LOCUS10381 [Geodia barretti]|uniref:Uncharacterized protein n=1 Tax=Geodia barretti TaxID=519541 RepID=A0AA35RTJ8_GEOBA|nr:hypothetical protein GBAR_LOCUS10381 [Geodia barretti]